MKVVRRFNNNVVLCIDNNGNEVVAFGKALGFHEIPYILDDLSKIERSYYGIENRYLNMINDLNSKSLDISSQILDLCRSLLKGVMNPNMLFTLADHIDFCIKRHESNLNFSMPLYEEIELLHPLEFEIAKRGVELINETYNINIPKYEAIGITMNIINSELDLELNSTYKDSEEIFDEITKIIEHHFEIQIRKNSLNYLRFLSHMKYLLIRIEKKERLDQGYNTMLSTITKDYPSTRECVDLISDYMIRNLNYKLSNDELFYLIVHINRLIRIEKN